MYLFSVTSSIDTEHVSRRRFLVGSGAGLGALLVGTGTAAAGETGRYVVGTSTPGAKGAAKRAAVSVRRDLDFGDIGDAVAGVSEGYSRNPHAEFTVPWSVEDADGTLDTVELRLTQTSPAGGTEAVVAIDVSGGSADGRTTLPAKHDDGSKYTYAVDLTVTDTTGKTGTDSVTVVENGIDK